MTDEFNRLAFEIVEEPDKEERRAIMLKMLDEIQKWLEQQRADLNKL